MNERLKNIWAKIKEFVGKLSSKTKKLIIAGVVLLLAVSVGVALYLNNKPYETLFTGLNDQEVSEIIGRLQEEQIEYKYESGGSILVPAEVVEQLRAQLVYEGYPKSGFTYDIFKDNVGLMSTDTEKTTYLLYELQDRIGATIRLFDNVKDAKVTIALGKEDKFVLGDKESLKPSASVVVITKDGEPPTEQQVKGIQRLVAKAIQGMEIENISILDGNGNDVTNADDTIQSQANKLKLELEAEIESIIRNKILNVLNPIYGEDNVKVSVKGTVDIDKKIREIIQYSAPPNEEDKQGIPSNQSTEQEFIRGGEGAAGVPGTETNADIPTYTVTNPDGTENYWRNQNVIDYLVNQVKEQAQIDAGTLTDLNISIVINGEDFGSLNRAELTNLVARAAGVSDEVRDTKIAVVATPFYAPPEEIVEGGETEGDGAQQSRLLLILAIAAGVLLLLLIILLVVLRKRKKKKQKQLADQQRQEELSTAAAQEALAAAAAAAGMDVDPNAPFDLLDIRNEKSLELKEKIRAFAEENPEISAQLLKSWLRGGESNG